jgi:hypothetical protein
MIGGSVLILQGQDGGSAANVMTMPVLAEGTNLARGKLVFTRYADQYFLHRAFWPGYAQGREAFKSRRELAIARDWNGGKPVQVPGNAAAIPR